VKAGGKHSLKMEGHVPPKRRLTFNGIHGILSQKIELLLKKMSAAQQTPFSKKKYCQRELYISYTKVQNYSLFKPTSDGNA
jgi:hypothetical protein